MTISLRQDPKRGYRQDNRSIVPEGREARAQARASCLRLILQTVIAVIRVDIANDSFALIANQ